MAKWMACFQAELHQSSRKTNLKENLFIMQETMKALL